MVGQALLLTWKYSSLGYCVTCGVQRILCVKPLHAIHELDISKHISNLKICTTV